MPLPFSLGVIVLIVGSILSLAVVDPLFMLVGLALFPSLALFNHYYTRRVEEPAATTQAKLGEVSTVAHETFEGALVVKTLGLEQREVDRLSEAADGLRTARLVVGRLRATFEPGLDALPTLGTIALLALGAWRVSTGVISTGDLVQAMALFGILTFPMRIVGFLLEEMARAVVADDRLDEVIAEASRPRPDPAAATPLPSGPLDVELRGVRFGYGGDPVLDRLDLVLAPGEVVALVGSTGSGKTTLCSLLAHLHRPGAGTIRIGGVDVTAAEPTSIRARVALVFQETFLFADTVRENLSLGEQVGAADVRWALERARADGFVARLPHGLDESLGERGVTLSGGQRQRLALARALLRRPRLLLLDDATSAVDATIEQQILDGLRSSLRHHAGRRPPRLDHRAGRPGPVPRRRPDRRQRHARRAGRDGPGLRRARAGLRGGGAVTIAPDRSPGPVPDRPDAPDIHDAAVEVLGESAPPGADEPRPHPPDTPDEVDILEAGALGVLRRGLAVTPELRQGVVLTAGWRSPRRPASWRSRSSSSRSSTGASSGRTASGPGSCTSPARSRRSR